MDSGRLIIRVTKAYNLKSKVGFTKKQHPYVVVTCGDETFKTEVCTNGHRTPEWKDASFQVVIPPGLDLRELSFAAYHQAGKGEDILIGKGRVLLMTVYQKGWHDARVPLLERNEHAGELSVALFFEATPARNPSIPVPQTPPQPQQPLSQLHGYHQPASQPPHSMEAAAPNPYPASAAAPGAGARQPPVPTTSRTGPSKPLAQPPNGTRSAPRDAPKPASNSVPGGGPSKTIFSRAPTPGAAGPAAGPTARPPANASGAAPVPGAGERQPTGAAPAPGNSKVSQPRSPQKVVALAGNTPPQLQQRGQQQHPAPAAAATGPSRAPANPQQQQQQQKYPSAPAAASGAAHAPSPSHHHHHQQQQQYPIAQPFASVPPYPPASQQQQQSHQDALSGVFGGLAISPPPSQQQSMGTAFGQGRGSDGGAKFPVIGSVGARPEQGTMWGTHKPNAASSYNSSIAF